MDHVVNGNQRRFNMMILDELTISIWGGVPAMLCQHEGKTSVIGLSKTQAVYICRAIETDYFLFEMYAKLGLCQYNTTRMQSILSEYFDVQFHKYSTVGLDSSIRKYCRDLGLKWQDYRRDK